MVKEQYDDDGFPEVPGDDDYDFDTMEEPDEYEETVMPPKRVAAPKPTARRGRPRKDPELEEAVREEPKPEPKKIKSPYAKLVQVPTQTTNAFQMKDGSLLTSDQLLVQIANDLNEIKEAVV